MDELEPVDVDRFHVSGAGAYTATVVHEPGCNAECDPPAGVHYLRASA